MDKGKIGITGPAYSVVAFVLAMTGQALLCGLLLAFVLLQVRDEKTGRNCMTAFFLSLSFVVLMPAFLFLFGLMQMVTLTINYRAGSVLTIILVILFSLAALAVVVLGIIGLARVAKGGDADIPLFTGLAWRANGLVRPQPQPQPPSYANYPPNYQQTLYSQPPQPQAPPVQPMPPQPMQGGPGMPPPYGEHPPVSAPPPWQAAPPPYAYAPPPPPVPQPVTAELSPAPPLPNAPEGMERPGF